MALTPLSTPLKTEYKPLGLEAFAQPLSQMQAKFDVAKSQIDDTEYTLERLSQDDSRAKEKLEDLNQKTSQLAENLIKTGNYRQATQKLKDLNKYYAKDAEILGISKNYKNYQEGLKKMQEGKYTKEDIDVWKAYTLGKFKGTEYDPSTGSYTQIDASPKIENLEDEIRDEALKLVQMAPTKVNEYFENIGIDSRVKATLKQKLSSGQGLAYEDIVNFLGTSTKYKNYLDEDARMKFFVGDMNSKKAALAGQSDNYFAFQDQIAEKGVNYYDNFIQQYQKDQAAGVDRSKELKIATDNRNNILELEANKFNDPEAYGRLTETLYRQDKLGYLRDVAGAAADIVDNRSLTYGEIKESENAKQNKKIIEESSNITVSAQPSTISTQGEVISSGITTKVGNALKEAEIEYPDIRDNIKAVKVEKTNKIANELGLTEFYAPGAKIPDVFNNGIELDVLSDRNNKINTKVSDLNTNIANYRNSLSANPSSLEERRIKAELNKAQDLRNTLIQSKANDNKVLNNAVNIGMTEFQNNKPSNIDDKTYNDIINLYKKSQNNSVKFLEELNNYEKDKDKLIKELAVEQNNYFETVTNINDSFRGGDFQAYQFPEIEELNNAKEYAKNSKRNIIDKSNNKFSTQIVGNILDTYNRSLTIDNPEYVVPPVINIDEDSNKLANEEFKELFDTWKTQAGDTENRGYLTVNANISNRTSKENIGNATFDPKLYNFDAPVYVGKLKDESGIERDTYKLLRYSPDRIDALQESFAKTGKLATVSPDSDRVPILGSGERKAWEARNPEEVYIQNITTKNPILGVKKNIEEQLNAALNPATNISNFDRQESVKNTLNNYAYYHLLDSPEITKYYTVTAKDLRDGVDNNVYKTKTITGLTNVDEKGNRKYFSKELTVYPNEKTGRGELVQILREHYEDSNGISLIPNNPNGVIMSDDNFTLVKNLPIELLKQDLLFGTAPQEYLFQMDGRAIAPALISNY